MRYIVALLALSLGLGVGGQAFGDSFADPLDLPARENLRPASTQSSAIGRAGERLVAVGVRGLIVVSDDGGKSWKQAAVPVQSDLLAVHFPTTTEGWVVGHDGVVLHSRDGGASWTRQFDGRAAETLLRQHFERLAVAGDPDAPRYLEDVGLNYESGPEQVLTGVWFEDSLHGFVSGSFGTLFRTTDGGQTWTSWVERVATDEVVHFNAVLGAHGSVFIASEQGMVFRLQPGAEQFEAIPTGYTGTFFGLVATRSGVIAHGLRGTAYRSRDGGENWHRLKTGVTTALTHAATTVDGRLLFVTADGLMLASDDEGDSFAVERMERPMALTGIAPAKDPETVVVTGIRGVLRMPMPHPAGRDRAGKEASTQHKTQ